MGNLFSKADDGAQVNDETELILEQQAYEALAAAAAKAMIKEQEQLAAYELAKQEDRKIDHLHGLYGFSARLIANLTCNVDTTFYRPKPTEWNAAFDQFIADVWTAEMREEIFWKCCVIPQMLPVLWPTGTADSAFHAANLYTKNSAGVVDQDVYFNGIKSKFPSYIAGLTTVFKNVMISNTYRFKEVDNELTSSLNELANNFCEQADDLLDDEAWYKLTQKFFDDLDKLLDTPADWRHMYARGRKGVCTTNIQLLPAAYPLQCPEFNIYEATMAISNEVINNFGQCCKKSDNSLVEKDYEGETITATINGKETTTTFKATDITNGGQCCKFDHSPLKKWSSEVVGEKWDIPMAQDQYTAALVVSATPVFKTPAVFALKDMGITSPTWKENPKVEEGLTDDGKYKIYINPTRNLSYEFMSPTGKLDNTWWMPPLTSNTPGYLKDWWDDMYKWVIQESITSVNQGLWTTGDLMMNSKILKQVYNRLIVDNAKWNLIFPLVQQVSMTKINGALLTTGGLKTTQLPQYIWRDSIDLEYTPLPNQKTEVVPLSVPRYDTQFQ